MTFELLKDRFLFGCRRRVGGFGIYALGGLVGGILGGRLGGRLAGGGGFGGVGTVGAGGANPNFIPAGGAPPAGSTIVPLAGPVLAGKQLYKAREY